MKHGHSMFTRAFLYLVNERPIPTILGSAGVGGGSTLVKFFDGVSPFLEFGTLCIGFLTALGGFALLARQLRKAWREDFGKKAKAKLVAKEV